MERKRTKLEWIMLVIVVAVASLVVASSFHNTAKLAKILGMPTLLVAGTVEIAFTTFLFLRGHQRALRLNTPVFLHALYFGLLALVTGVNMWGLTDMHIVWGPIIGASISALLWGMETTLVWLWTESHKPHRKTIREIEREADREIAEEQAIQRIEWKRHEARQPSLSLIRMVRKQEAKREKEIAKGLPQYFLRKPEPTPELVAEPIVQKPEKEEPTEETAVIPMPMRQIGFHMEQPEQPKAAPAPRFQPNIEARTKAIETAKALREELGRIPTKGELMDRGLSEYYAKWAKGELKKQ